MGRNIVICFDGTNNEYAATNTNVVKIYQMLDLDSGEQIAYYQPGIGTMAPDGVWNRFGQWLIKQLDLAVAWLLEQHVCDGYRYLMRYYGPGDQVFIFGFSRGAYSARALAAMVHQVGLLSAGNEELIPFAWDAFRKIHAKNVAAGFKRTFSRVVKVHFLGVWDTVSSVGWAWNPQSLPYTRNNPSVEILRHAMALDERRVYFPQNLWTDEKVPGQDAVQIWFPGVHCDVGGGYLESEAGLSKIALQWMVDAAVKAGLKVDSTERNAIIPAQSNSEYSAPDPTAKKHESLHGFWWILEWIPKRIKDPATDFKTHRWTLHRGGHRYVANGASIHNTVFDRTKKVPDYKPPNIPEKYTIAQ